MDRAEAARLAALAFSQFPHLAEKADTRATAEGWALTLGDLGYAVAQQALAVVLAESDFFPTVAAIRKAARAIMGEDGDTAGEAWGEVRMLIRQGWATGLPLYRNGERITQPPYSSPLVERAIYSMGGLEAVARSENEEVTRAHFLRVYNDLAERERLVPEPMRERLYERRPMARLSDVLERAMPERKALPAEAGN